jgi:vancomycin resistance protein YoaR
MRDGILVETIAGVAGKAVDFESFYNQLNDAVSKQYVQSVFSNNQLGAVAGIKLDVPLITENPRVTKETISKYGIKDLVGTVETSFVGGTADRIHNIKTGLSKINGILLAPGQELSTVNAIGYVSAETGYVEELVIKGDATVKEFGGGLCQIATTLFRLALNAGLPVTERINHRYVVGYYGPGLDATIYGPHPDLRFVNDTKG